jgi:hypothetical protein
MPFVISLKYLGAFRWKVHSDLFGFVFHLPATQQWYLQKRHQSFTDWDKHLTRTLTRTLTLILILTLTPTLTLTLTLTLALTLTLTLTLT